MHKNLSCLLGLGTLVIWTWLLVRLEVHIFTKWAMPVHAYSCTSLYLDTDATQLVLNSTVSL